MKKLLLILCLFSFSHLYSQIPENYIGNWINQKSNHWEYGFFEDFAIYDCDFWDYESIISNKKGKTEIVLRKGKEIQKLNLSQIDDKHIHIKSGKQKNDSFVLMQQKYPDYPYEDNSMFPIPNFRPDSATIIGYYRNLDKIPAQYTDRLNYSPFEVAVNDFISDQEKDYYADIDSTGRFKITFPIFNTQELYIDWKRAKLIMVVEPGDSLFLFINMNDYIPLESDKNWEGYSDRSKQVIFMGKNARVNNEITQYKNLRVNTPRWDDKNFTDMEYLREHEGAYNQKKQDLNKFIEKKPFLSEKFKYYKHQERETLFIQYLMQRRFNSLGKSLQEGFLEYVEQKLTLENESIYTLLNNFKSALTDYIGYIEDIKTPSSITISIETIAERISEEGRMTPEIRGLVDEVNKIMAEIKSNPESPQITELNNRMQLYMNQLFDHSLIRETIDAFGDEEFVNTRIADSLLANPNLRELWTASRYYEMLDHTHKPMSLKQQHILKEKVKNSFLLNYIENIHSYYENNINKSIAYETNLINTKHLNEYMDADKLFNELIAPYKGKVIYVDFWGTWCGACRKDMSHAYSVKEKLVGQDVIFMYFANRSPEESWKSLIKEYSLTGENIVHYRLPDEQQAMIERKFSINSFPTYMLIDKAGKVVNTNAASPQSANEAVRQIKELLEN